jgi:predicted transcriptional regulator of viral defense system
LLVTLAIYTTPRQTTRPLVIVGNSEESHFPMTSDTQAMQVMRIVAEHGAVHSRDLTARQIPRATLMRLVRAGRLKQAARGLYVLPDQPLSRQHSLAEVAARSSRGVFCLLTALRFHKITTPPSDAIWLAIPNKARAPTSGHPPLEILRFSGAALTEGVEQHIVDGVTIRVYSVAKTVADCFKFRHKLGLEVALEALRKSRRRGLVTTDELRHYAQVCRVTEVMRPYLAGG